MTAERVLLFTCQGLSLPGILHPGAPGASRGVLVVVGGPQYRVGSHRQFVLLARDLAAAGVPVLRFDCRGMGDAEGEFPGFEDLDADLAAAIDAFFTQVPSLREVVIWGLCDAASAALFYAGSDARVRGLVLLAFPATFTSLADHMIGATGALQTLYVALAVVGVYLTIVGWRPARTDALPTASSPGTTFPRAA